MKYGKKVQNDFIKFFKSKTNIDLNGARDTQFDNRKCFNIDENLLGINNFNRLKKFALQKESSNYEIELAENGENRTAVFVIFNESN